MVYPALTARLDVAAITAGFAIAAALSLAFVVIESRTADPMVAVRLFRERVFAGGSFARTPA
jgi:hypothetical protein